METKQKSFFSKRGFTIAEILMVISIIAFLGAIILVAARGALEKARIARGLNFSASIKHGLGHYLVGEWKFEEGDITTVYDSSGYENHGEWQSGYGYEANDIPQLGMAGKFDNEKTVKIENSESLQVSGDLTIEAWVYPENLAAGRQDIIYKQTYREFEVIMEPSGEILFVHGNGPPFEGGGHESFYAPDGMALTENKWNHIAITRNMDTEKISFYLNGKHNGDESFLMTPVTCGYGVWIGSREGSYYFFEGKMDEVRIYAETLTSTQIKQHYVEGARKLGLLSEE